MLKRSTTQFIADTREELLPGYRQEFPYYHNRYMLDDGFDQVVPWHWHNPVELFYIESGLLEYSTPNAQLTFPAGSGGLLNANVLHSTRRRSGHGANIQLLHIFDPTLISGGQDNQISQKYVTPILSRPQLELIPLYPENASHQPILARIRDSHHLDPDVFGYELRLRAALSEIWLALCGLLPEYDGRAPGFKNSEKLKAMMIFIHEHFAEKLTVADIAAAGYMSERECYRTFRECLRSSPQEYLTSYRLQTAKRLMEHTDETATRVGLACGFSSSSHFGKLFQDRFGLSPKQYRQQWQDRDMNWQ